MVTNRVSKRKLLKNRSISALILGLLSLFVAGFLAPVVSAQSAEANDLSRALINDRYYVSNTVKNKLKTDAAFAAKHPDLEAKVKDAVNKYKGRGDARAAVIGTDVIPANLGSNTQRYAEFLYDFIGSKPDALVMVNAQTSEYFIVSSKLSSSDRSKIVDEVRPTFASKGIGAGVDEAIDKTLSKIAGNATAGFITTIVIVAVIVLLIIGIIVATITSTKKRWAQQVANLQQLANQVSDKVVAISDNISFLPDNIRHQADADFGEATRNFSDANAKLRELEGASSVQLLLQGADFNRRLNLTGAQFEQLRQSLTSIEQKVNRQLPGL